MTIRSVAGRSAGHGGREVTEPNLVTTKSKPVKCIPDASFGTETLKTLDREFLAKMLTVFFQSILPKISGLQSSVFNSADMNTAIIMCKVSPDPRKREKEMTKILEKINIDVVFYMNDYIEKEKEESCKKYYRDCNLYESKIEDSRLILTWY
jgi:hypothetical protein